MRRALFRRRLWWTPLLLALSIVCAPAAGRAQDHDSAVREAAKHFRRGVALYNEADYRSAIVEFRRAHTLVPNTATLYNVGEAQYQLLDYAGALTTFEQFIAEASPADGHWAEVQSNLEVLRARVGRVTITTVPVGAEIAVDDAAVGTTPLDKPIVVNLGQRKVSASVDGRVPLVRYVDIAAEDNVSLTLQLPQASIAATPVRLPPVADRAAPKPTLAPGSNSAVLRTAGFVTTGVLTAAALTMGAMAIAESSTLKNDRDAYPASPSVLRHEARVTRTYTVIADSLGIAAVLVGGLTLYSTFTSPPHARTPATRGARLQVGMASAWFESTF